MEAVGWALRLMLRGAWWGVASGRECASAYRRGDFVEEVVHDCAVDPRLDEHARRHKLARHARELDYLWGTGAQRWCQ